MQETLQKGSFKLLYILGDRKMKLLPKKSNYKARVKITSIDRETKEFDSIQEAADFLEVTRMAIYQALKNKGRCRGCKIERI